MQDSENRWDRVNGGGTYRQKRTKRPLLDDVGAEPGKMMLAASITKGLIVH